MKNEFFTEVRLEAIRTMAQARISESELRDRVDFSLSIQQHTGDLLMSMESRMYASKIADYDEELYVPATWWDHFKHHVMKEKKKRPWWSKWMSPPNYNRHVFSAEGRLVFPDIADEFNHQHRTFVIYDHTIRVKPFQEDVYGLEPIPEEQS